MSAIVTREPGRYFEVSEEQCDQCLFTPNRIVPPGRMTRILSDCRTHDAHFICHKFTLDGKRDVCCRGFYDANPHATNLMRIAERLDVVKFVPLP